MKTSPVGTTSKNQSASRMFQPLSLFVAHRLTASIAKQPTVELVEEKAKDTEVRPPLKFFDDQCGCN